MKKLIAIVALSLSTSAFAVTIKEAQQFLNIHHPGYTVTKVEFPLLRTKEGETFRVMDIAGRQVALKCSAFKKHTNKNGC